MLGITSPVQADHLSPPLAILYVFSSDAPMPAHRSVKQHHHSFKPWEILETVLVRDEAAPDCWLPR